MSTDRGIGAVLGNPGPPSLSVSLRVRVSWSTMTVETFSDK